MPNIRIKDIPTTASATSSTDFIGIDGSANGTRKLDAYSPTFGGNLTVSGTGLSSVAGALNVTGALLAHQTAALNMAHEGSSLSQLVSYGADASTYGRLNLTLRKAGTGVGAVTALALTSTDATLAGNLTVSGGTTTIIGSAPALALKRSSDNSFVGYIDATTTGTLRLFSGVGGSNALAASFPQNGNLLLKSDGIDSGNGKLQLATHTTSAGGIGFGTDTSLYRAGSGQLVLSHASLPVFSLYEGSTNTGEFYSSSGNVVLGSKAASTSLTFRTVNTIALTLDSSQNATFAGKTYTAAGAAATPAISFSGDTDSGFYNPGGNQVSLACGGGQIWNTTVNGLSMASGKDIYLGNAYQAATVVPTGYVTIKDSTGTVYKVCVLL